jgi:3-oxoadipate enol-lactonase
VATPDNGAVDLDCREEGQGPPVVLLHGLGGSRTVWNLVIPRLSDRFRVLAPDLRGHGRSGAPPGAPVGFVDLEQDLIRLFDARSLGAVHLVGLSAGALLALRMALDRPDRVRSLTLIAGAVYTDSHTRAVTERWAEAYAEDGSDGLAFRLLKDLYYPDWIEAHMEVVDQVRDQMRTADVRAPVLWSQEARAFDERPRIASLATPTLIVQGMDDHVIDAAHARILRQSIQSAQLRILAQTGHMVPVERPVETAEAIAGFVTSVESGRATTA